MTHDVKITGLHRKSAAKPNKGGSTILAQFDCIANGFEIVSMAFVRTARGGLTVWPPRIENETAWRRSIAIVDDSLRHAITMKARDVYRLLGGEDVETIGKSGPIGAYDEDMVRSSDAHLQR